MVLTKIHTAGPLIMSYRPTTTSITAASAPVRPGKAARTTVAAILFGSISTVADTSELQREAFNQAFETLGLAWFWGREEYRALLEKSGGADRIADYAADRGERVDAGAVHRSKSEIFRRRLTSGGLQARPGVIDSIHGARDAGLKVGLVTTTAPENVAALLAGLGPRLSPADFDVIVDATSVDRPKPDGAAYAFALGALGEEPTPCVAIEDNLGGVLAARAARLRCVAFPNENTAGHDFGLTKRVDRVVLDELVPAAGGV